MGVLPQILAIYMVVSGSANSLAQRIAYYEQLGMVTVHQTTETPRYALLTDGRVRLLLTEDPMSPSGLLFYTPDPNGMAGQIVAQGGPRYTPSNGWFANFEVYTADQHVVYLGNTPEIAQLEAKFQAFDSTGFTNRLGVMAEYSMPISDLETARAEWKKLGFEVGRSMPGQEPYAIGMHAGFPIGLHQTTEFSTPAISFFSGKMYEVIAALRADNCAPIKVIPGADPNREEHAVYRAPDGQLVNLFTYDLQLPEDGRLPAEMREE